MRKIKWSCADAQVHHALAVLAITQAGMSRGFRSSRGLAHEVAWNEGDLRGYGGQYEIKMATGHTAKCDTQTALGCHTEWMFSWPDLKLLGMATILCEHSGYELDPTADEEN